MPEIKGRKQTSSLDIVAPRHGTPSKFWKKPRVCRCLCSVRRLGGLCGES